MSDKPVVSVVITDLDNTLFDWFHFWYQAFSAMLDEIVRISGLPRERLLPEVQKVHEKHGTAEYAFLIEEIPVLADRHPGESLVKVYGPAIDAYRAARREHLRLYPGVMDTLLTLRERGCLIVAYTESMGFYSNDRLRRLGLDGVIDILYSPEDHRLPDYLTPESVRAYPASHYELKETTHRHTPAGELKPNPHLLLDIIQDLGAPLDHVLYVGDSLVKDVAMAQEAKVLDVWAKYGSSHHKDEYELLRHVTHWTKEQVERERTTTASNVHPTYTLESGLSELLAKFNFRRHSKGAQPVPYERTRDLIEVWKTIVQVQQHFNDIELRIRSLAITVIGVLLGAVAFAVRERLQVGVDGHEVSAGAFLILAALLSVPGFWMMDRWWYHRLLQGAVEAGTAVERSLAIELPEIGLGTAIREASPVKVFWWSVHSTRKIDLFYGGLAAVLGVLLYVFLKVVSAADGPGTLGTANVTPTVVVGQRQETTNQVPVLGAPAATPTAHAEPSASPSSE